MISRIWIHYLISDKTSIIEMFNVYKIKLEKKLDKKIYIVKSDHGDEFYSKCDETSQHDGPFVNYLKNVEL